MVTRSTVLPLSPAGSVPSSLNAQQRLVTMALAPCMVPQLTDRAGTIYCRQVPSPLAELQQLVGWP